MQYQGYTVKFEQVKEARIGSFCKVEFYPRTLPCLVKGRGKTKEIIPLYDYLPGGWASMEQEYWWEIEKKPFWEWRLDNFPMPVDWDWQPPLEKVERLKKEIMEWNSIIWEEKRYLEEDEDEDTGEWVVRHRYSVWSDKEGKAKSQTTFPERRSFEKELLLLRKQQWNSLQQKEAQVKAEQLWLEIYQAALDAAMADGGKSWAARNAAVEAEAEKLRAKMPTTPAAKKKMTTDGWSGVDVMKAFAPIRFTYVDRRGAKTEALMRWRLEKERSFETFHIEIVEARDNTRRIPTGNGVVLLHHDSLEEALAEAQKVWDENLKRVATQPTQPQKPVKKVPAPAPALTSSSEWKEGDRVSHPTLGVGTITKVLGGGKVTLAVKFDSSGLKIVEPSCCSAGAAEQETKPQSLTGGKPAPIKRKR